MAKNGKMAKETAKDDKNDPHPSKNTKLLNKSQIKTHISKDDKTTNHPQKNPGNPKTTQRKLIETHISQSKHKKRTDNGRTHSC